MSFSETLSRWIQKCETVLEAPPVRKAFWLVVGAVFIIMGVVTVFRAEVPKFKKVEHLHYNSPVEIAEGEDDQAVWRSSEFRGFRQIAWGVVMEGRDPYLLDPAKGLDHVRAYAPFFGLAFFPFAVGWQIPGLGSGLFYAIGFLFAILSAWYASRWVDDQPRFGRFALLVILTLPLSLNVMARCESDMYVVFPIALAFFWIMRGRRQFSAGALLGFAACFKVLPGLFGLYLICTRQWRALAGMCAAGVLLMVILPLAVWGPQRTTDLYKSWANVVVGPYFKGGATTFIGSAYRSSNQSLASTVHRFFSVPSRGTSKGSQSLRLASFSPQSVSRVVKVLMLAVILWLIALWAYRGGDKDARTRAALMATVPVGILLLSEVSLTTHHVTLLLVLATILVRIETFADAQAKWWGWLLPAWLVAIIVTAVAKPVSPYFFLTVAMLIGASALALRSQPGPAPLADKASS